jgi:glucose/arabinose dehydrogenase
MKKRWLPFLGLLFIAACGGDARTSTSSPIGDVPAAGSTSTEPANDSGTDSATENPSFPASLGAPIDGWTEPVDMAIRYAAGAAPLEYLVERTGVISVLDGDRNRASTALDMSDLTMADGERGLLGLAFSFDGSRAFVNYTDLDGNTNIDQYYLNSDGTFDRGSRTRLYFLTQPYPNHNGGEIVWADGELYIFTGDGGSGGDPERVALNPRNPLGKVIRLREVDGRWDTGDVIAIGLRNPWRVFLDPLTDIFWITDVGQNAIEEINMVARGAIEGASFGWSYLEAGQVFNGDQADAHALYTSVEPMYEYQHSGGRCSISGGAVYRGESIAAVGTWFAYADWCSGEVLATCFEDSGEQCGSMTIGNVPRPVGVVADAGGELWVLSQDGLVVPITSG